jgi:Polysaccharide deacetylase
VALDGPHRLPNTSMAVVFDSELSELGARLSRSVASERDAWVYAITERSKKVPNIVRLEVLQKLENQLSVELPASPPAEYAPLTWDQVREMATNGIDFGAHTDTHPILSMLPIEEARQEITVSKRRIEEELRRPVLHFCYPNGKEIDLSKEVVAAIKSAGYKTAVTTVAGLNDPAADPFRLKRIGVEPDSPKLYFRQCAAGFRV